MKNLSHLVDLMVEMVVAVAMSFSSLIHPLQLFLISTIHLIARQPLVTRVMAIVKMAFQEKISSFLFQTELLFTTKMANRSQI